MRLISAMQRRSRHTKAPVPNGDHSSIGNPRNKGQAPPSRLDSPEFLLELQSAASMIMSREECAALEQELRRQSHHAAA